MLVKTCSGYSWGCCDQIWLESVKTCRSYKLKTVTERKKERKKERKRERKEEKKETGQIQDPAARAG